MLIIAKDKKLEADLFRPKVLTHTIVEVSHFKDEAIYQATSEVPFEPVLTPTEKLLLCLPKADAMEKDEIRLKIAVIEAQDQNQFSFKLLEERKSDLRMYPRVWLGLNLSFYGIDQTQVSRFKQIVDLQDLESFEQAVLQSQLQGCAIENELFNFSVGGLQIEVKQSIAQSIAPCDSTLSAYLKLQKDLVCALQMQGQPKVLVLAKILRIENVDDVLRFSIQWHEPNLQTIELLSEYTLTLQDALLRI
jgi:hypothetical protein